MPYYRGEGHNVDRFTMKHQVKDTEVAHHPATGHRTPDQLAKDSAGPMSEPDLDVIAGQSRVQPSENAEQHDTDVSPFGRPSAPE